jgi:Na+-transporting methylmalonyl-CoA/oxaloacetate decarboxylase gamma subunit
MSDNLSAALLITVLGMSIVFGIIVLTWGIMAALNRIPPGKDELAEVDQVEADQATERVEAGYSLPGAERAAAVAVAVALALGERSRPVRVRPATEPSIPAVSAWQSVMRGRQLKQTYRRPRH